MKPSARDLQALRVPIAALAIALAAGAASIYYSKQGVQAASGRLQAQEAQLNEARTRLHKSGDERDTIVRFLGRYQQLQNQGLIGQEQRINWLDGLRLANNQAEMFGAEYQVSTQQPYPFAAELNPGKVRLQQSVMKLSLRLLHEGDLARFFDLLENQKAGLFSINECELDRIDPPGKLLISMQPHLRAQCELAWITINAETAAEKTP